MTMSTDTIKRLPPRLPEGSDPSVAALLRELVSTQAIETEEEPAAACADGIRERNERELYAREMGEALDALAATALPLARLRRALDGVTPADPDWALHLMGATDHIAALRVSLDAARVNAAP